MREGLNRPNHTFINTEVSVKIPPIDSNSRLTETPLEKSISILLKKGKQIDEEKDVPSTFKFGFDLITNHVTALLMLRKQEQSKLSSKPRVKVFYSGLTQKKREEVLRNGAVVVPKAQLTGFRVMAQRKPSRLYGLSEKELEEMEENAVFIPLEKEGFADNFQPEEIPPFTIPGYPFISDQNTEQSQSFEKRDALARMKIKAELKLSPEETVLASLNQAEKITIECALDNLKRLFPSHEAFTDEEIFSKIKGYLGNIVGNMEISGNEQHEANLGMETAWRYMVS